MGLRFFIYYSSTSLSQLNSYSCISALNEINFIWPADETEVKQWSTQVCSNLSNCRKAAWKNLGFDGTKTLAFLILFGLLQLSCEAIHWKKGKFFRSSPFLWRNLITIFDIFFFWKESWKKSDLFFCNNCLNCSSLAMDRCFT